MAAWFTPESLEWLKSEGVNMDAIGWNFVSQTQLSVARHFGGCSYNGNFYTYVPPTDELVREDVVKAIMERREPKKKRPPRKSRLPRETDGKEQS